MFKKFSEYEKIAIVGLIERVFYSDGSFSEKEKKFSKQYLEQNGISEFENLRRRYYKDFSSNKKFKTLLKTVDEDNYRKFVDAVLRVALSDGKVDTRELEIFDFLAKTWKVKRGILLDHH